MSEHFLDENGNPGADRKRVSPGELTVPWRASTARIPVSFAVACALHETTYTSNEQDTEPNGHKTGGIFQLDIPTVNPPIVGDAYVAFGPAGFAYSVYDVANACAIFAVLSERRLDWLLENAKDRDGNSLDESNLPPDVWSYLALGHNQGTGAMKKTIEKHGLDWNRYQNDPDNASQGIVAHGYGDDAQTGGPDYTSDMAGDPFDFSFPGAPTARNKATLSWGAILLLVTIIAWYLLTQTIGGKRWLASISA